MAEENIFTGAVHNGRITIPQNIRTRHGIETGDDVTCEVIKKVDKK